jgi:aspartyl-tRNA(Asn)/glutamyl-tRNA(Gln) amidotransferase subunit C
MDREVLRRLEKLNQLALTEEEKEDFLAFYGEQEAARAVLDTVDTASVERMVHVMPVYTVVREDVVIKNFTREDLQKGAPETTDGYWQVPRLVE